ncbi:UNVERIFIED_CONTAM: hypothetical protein NCL1_42310 [Trichonephila clavipes]
MKYMTEDKPEHNDPTDEQATGFLVPRIPVAVTVLHSVCYSLLTWYKQENNKHSELEYIQVQRVRQPISNAMTSFTNRSHDDVISSANEFAYSPACCDEYANKETLRDSQMIFYTYMFSPTIFNRRIRKVNCSSVITHVLEYVVRVEALPFQVFLQWTKHMEIAGQHVQTVGRMVQRLPFELVQFHLCDSGDVWRCVIMEQNHTLCEQPRSFVLDGPA